MLLTQPKADRLNFCYQEYNKKDYYDRNNNSFIVGVGQQKSFLAKQQQQRFIVEPTC